MRLLILLPLLCLCSCAERDKAVADSAATIYEAWQAHKAGVPDQYVGPVIESNSMAIIHAVAYKYPPGEVKK